LKLNSGRRGGKFTGNHKSNRSGAVVVPYGFTGKMLRVNLGKGTISVEGAPEEFYRRYLGGGLLGGIAYSVNSKLVLMLSAPRML